MNCQDRLIPLWNRRGFAHKAGSYVPVLNLESAIADVNVTLCAKPRGGEHPSL